MARDSLRRPQLLLQVGTIICGSLAMGDGLWALTSADRAVSTVGELASGLAVAGSAAVLYHARRPEAPPPPSAPPAQLGGTDLR